MIKQRNPAWVDKALKQNWAKLEAAVGSKWMPISWSDESERGPGEYAGAKGDKYQEYGTGHYGTVLRTRDPHVVLKVSSDPSEAQFVAYATKLGSFPEGLVKYFRVTELPGAFRGRPIFATWREAAHDVGLFAQAGAYGHMDTSKHVAEVLHSDVRSVRESRAYLDKFREAAGHVRDWIKRHPNEFGKLKMYTDRAEETDYPAAFADPTQKVVFPRSGTFNVGIYNASLPILTELMENTNGLHYVGGALRFYLERGVLLADVHANNVGLVDRPGHHGPMAVITDPGHAVFLQSPQQAASPRVANTKKKSSKTWTCARIRKEVATWPKNWQTRFRGFEMVCGTEKAFERVSCEYRKNAAPHCDSQRGRRR